MQGATGTTFSAKNKINLAVFIAALMLFAVLGPYMSYRKNAGLDLEIVRIKAEIEEQDLWREAYLPLQKLLEEQEGQTLPVIKKMALAIGETSQISMVLTKMAQDAGLESLNIHPDVSSLMGNSGEIVVDARVSGNYRGLRTFLHDVVSMPSFKDVITMEIREIPSAREMNLKVRLFTEE